MSYKTFKEKSAPAYQEYASDVSAERRFKEMSLAERGLRYSMRNECWLSGSIPSDPERIGTIINRNVEEVRVAMTERVISYFEASGNGELIAPDLDRYKAELAVRREKQSAGGKTGGVRSQERRKQLVSGTSPESRPEANHEGQLQGTVKVLSRDELSGVEESRSESLNKDDEFLAEYVRNERLCPL